MGLIKYDHTALYDNLVRHYGVRDVYLTATKQGNERAVMYLVNNYGQQCFQGELKS